MPKPAYHRSVPPRSVASFLLALIAGVVAAADPTATATPAASAPATPAAAAPVATAAPAAPDPTAAIVAQGPSRAGGPRIYRQRDLDAFVAIAQRHTKNKLDQNACDQLRQTLVKLFVAREAFKEALEELPPALTGKSGTAAAAHDAFVLDLLEYDVVATDTVTHAVAQTADPAEVAPSASPTGAVIVNLPVMTQSRTLDKLGRRQLVIGISLLFPDAATAKSYEARAPLIRDALLGCAQTLAPAQFLDPDQVMLKSAFVKAIQVKIPEFPADGVLIPQLDAGPADPVPPAP